MFPAPAATADERSPAAAVTLARPGRRWAAPGIAAALPVLLAASLCLRLVLAGALPLTADEAYAVAVSRSHALSYYDHPPMMFALARAMADLSGAENPFLMRLPFVAMGTASIWLLHDITRRMYGMGAAVWAAAAFVLSPFFLTFGQGLIVPDGPLDFGLLATLWLIQPVLSGAAAAGWRWPAAGLALGFALLGKYQAVLFGAGALLALAAVPAWRVWLRRPGPWVALALAALCALPVVLWNAQHHWASFAFQAGRAYQKTSLLQHAGGLLNVLAGQALYLLPVTWFAAHRGIAAAFSKGARDDERLLAILAVVPILVFDPIALVGRHALAHWAMSGFLFALPLVGKARAEAAGARTRLHVAAAAIAVCAALLSLQAATGALSALPVAGRFMPDLGEDNLDWTGLRAAIPDDGRFIAVPDWVSAGRVSLAVGPGHPIVVMSDPHHFQFMAAATPGAEGYFVSPSCAAGADGAGRLAARGPAGRVAQPHGAAPGFCLGVTPVTYAGAGRAPAG